MFVSKTLPETTDDSMKSIEMIESSDLFTKYSNIRQRGPETANQRLAKIFVLNCADLAGHKNIFPDVDTYRQCIFLFNAAETRF